MLRLFNTCRRDLSQMASFTFTGPRFTINQPPGSPRHRTSLFDKPKIKLFAARIYWISSTNLEAIWIQLQYDYWSLDPHQLVGVVAASCTSLTLFYAAAWLWGLPLITVNIFSPEHDFDKSRQIFILGYHEDVAFEVVELTIYYCANVV